jgi:hypothetical protein
MKLADYLTQKKLTYAAFAQMLGTPNAKMNVCRYALGQRHPRPHVAAKIVEVTKGRVTLKDIYGVEDQS